MRKNGGDVSLTWTSADQRRGKATHASGEPAETGFEVVLLDSVPGQGGPERLRSDALEQLDRARVLPERACDICCLFVAAVGRPLCRQREHNRSARGNSAKGRETHADASSCV